MHSEEFINGALFKYFAPIGASLTAAIPIKLIGFESRRDEIFWKSGLISSNV
jgi:hypothetical protein